MHQIYLMCQHVFLKICPIQRITDALRAIILLSLTVKQIAYCTCFRYFFNEKYLESKINLKGSKMKQKDIFFIIFPDQENPTFAVYFETLKT